MMKLDMREIDEPLLEGDNDKEELIMSSEQ